MKRKVSFVLNIAILLLAVSLAAIFAIQLRWLAAVGFALVALLNVWALVLRIRQGGKPPQQEGTWKQD